MMNVKRTVVLGMLAFAALTGCTTGAGRFASDTNSATDAVSASPAFGSDDAGAMCAQNGGWYDGVAGACDSNAP